MFGFEAIFFLSNSWHSVAGWVSRFVHLWRSQPHALTRWHPLVGIPRCWRGFRVPLVQLWCTICGLNKDFISDKHGLQATLDSPHAEFAIKGEVFNFIVSNLDLSREENHQLSHQTTMWGKGCQSKMPEFSFSCKWSHFLLEEIIMIVRELVMPVEAFVLLKGALFKFMT